jgi:hypothetical protein
MLTQARLREVLDYDEATGVFVWKMRLAQRLRVGDVAGSLTEKGYLIIRIDTKPYLAHRLVWFYVHGVIPERVEHRDRNGLNNAIGNLRLATQSQNLYNIGLRDSNTSGAIGVHWDRSKNKWTAQIRAEGKNRFLGRFDTLEEAAAVRRKATDELHGEFAYFRSA